MSCRNRRLDRVHGRKNKCQTHKNGQKKMSKITLFLSKHFLFLLFQVNVIHICVYKVSQTHKDKRIYCTRPSSVFRPKLKREHIFGCE